jgi:hypothetical protein
MHEDIASYDKVVFAAMSKRNFYLRENIVKFILEQGYTPTCAFVMFSYFLLDTVNRRALISANNALIKKSDELWVFGCVSDGVRKEVELAHKLNLPVKYFELDKVSDRFVEVPESDALVELS